MVWGHRITAASGRPLAWLAGFALVLLALTSLHFDRASQSPSPIVSVIDSAILASLDTDGDEPQHLDGDGLLVADFTPAPIVVHAASIDLPSHDAGLKPVFFLSVSARGPPPARI
ncbi:MAG: hypothetical protein BGP04_14915 [Rhizobiales bacterium 62-17]|nr:hypothetical protein [Hyphomicrobiales bacterium]OJY03077.1 MAG: hypothetical protein BGP04_14915 [Rhizobiales bacterium 62-17]